MSIQRLAVSCALLASIGGGALQAQAADSSSDSVASVQRHRTVWQIVAGRPQARTAYVGWHTLHFLRRRKNLIDSHFWGATARGVHAGTFMTSYQDRAFEVAVERVWVRLDAYGFNAQAGYRAGLMYGYDEELMDLAGRTPVIPAASLLVDLGWKPIGVQFAYSGIVMTVGGVLRF